MLRISWVVVLLLILVVLSFWGFYISIKPPKILSNITPADFDLDYEDVTFVTKDGLKLKGWFIPKTKRAKTIILLHGYPADKGDILPALSFLHKNYNLFLFDFRYLGQSEGKYSTAGAKERYDLEAAVKYLKSRGIKEVGIWGFSMGGAVALMTAENLPEIKAIVAESSYARLSLMTVELYQLPILRNLLGFLTTLWAKAILGIDATEVAPVESARNLQIPVLLIHSKNDQVIPFKNALLLQEALKNNPQAEFWFAHDLVHGQLGGDYQKRLEKFFKKSL